MQLITSALLAVSAMGVTAATTPSSQSTYYLKTKVKPNQGDKSQFNNLYLNAYHSGAGFNDAVLLPSKTNAVVGYLEKTNVTAYDGHAWYNQLFNVSNTPYPYELVIIQDADGYAAWQPVEIDTSISNNVEDIGFFISSSGLQLSNAPMHPKSNDVLGWIVCQWWRGVPQLFYRIATGSAPTPSSCADVDLIPEYLAPTYGTR